MKKAGTVNPIFVLDEVDKMSTDFRGDPSAALMEVLDPGIESFLYGPLPGRRVRPFESHVRVHGQRAAHHSAAFCRTRMEILRLPGYTEQEKLEIAKRFLVKRFARSGRASPTKNLKFTDEGLLHLIRHYTHEAGGRSLEREISEHRAEDGAQSGHGRREFERGRSHPPRQRIPGRAEVPPKCGSRSTTKSA